MKKLEITTDVPNEIHLARTFDAPRRLVMKAMTTPALMTRWLGGVRATVVSADVDLRAGGKYRNVFRRPDGFEFAFSGVYREVAEDRLVHSESFEGQPGECIVTITLAETGEKTTMSMVMQFPSQMVRDMVLKSGMTDGAGESYDKLDELVRSL